MKTTKCFIHEGFNLCKYFPCLNKYRNTLKTEMNNIEMQLTVFSFKCKTQIPSNVTTFFETLAF